jgi:hypothetical protein
MLRGLLKGLAAAFFAWELCSAATAATPILDANGRLIGATDVNVGGQLHEVHFYQCYNSFSCLESGFTSESAATAAAQALLDQVFLDGPQGLFDSDPSLTRGCTNEPVYSSGFDACWIVVPYTYGNMMGSVAFNSSTTDSAGPGFGWMSHGQDTLGGFVFATFVPEPSAWALMLLGFGAMGLVLRRQRGRPVDQVA